MSNALLPTQYTEDTVTLQSPAGWGYRIAAPTFRVRGPRDRDVWNLTIEAISKECAEYLNFIASCRMLIYELHVLLDLSEGQQRAAAVLGQHRLMRKEIE